MPMGAPSYRPDPKSGWAVLVAPMVATQAAELAETGSWSTGVFQILFAGRNGQLPMAGDWAMALETASFPRTSRVPARSQQATQWIWDRGTGTGTARRATYTPEHLITPSGGTGRRRGT